MSKGKWAVMLAVSAAMVSGCGGGGGSRPAGIRGRVVDSSGRGIANAQVSVVEIPPGGMDELERMVDEGKTLWGWHFTTDEDGRFCLTGIPTGRVVLAEMTVESPPYYVPPPPPRGDETFAEAFRRGYESTRPRVRERFTHEEGPWLGIVVKAPGYQTYIGMWRFGGPDIDLKEAITLYERGQARLDANSAGFTVTLAPLEGGPAAVTASYGAEEEKRCAVRIRVFHVPESALARYLASGQVRQPSWGPGPRGETAADRDTHRGPVGQQ